MGYDFAGKNRYTDYRFQSPAGPAMEAYDHMVLAASNNKQQDLHEDTGGYVSIELPIKSMGAVYQSRLWNVALKGMCFVVKDGSAIISHLHVGDVLTARYRTDTPGQPETIADTRIRHITHETSGRFKGHHLVGLGIIESTDADTSTIPVGAGH